MEEIEDEVSSSNEKYNFWDYYKELPNDYIDETITLPTNNPKMVFVNVLDITLFKMPSLERMVYEDLHSSLSSNTVHIYSDSMYWYSDMYLCIWYQ